MECICSHESLHDPEGSSATVAEIRRICARYTHLYAMSDCELVSSLTTCSSVPNYHTVSKRVSAGRLSGVLYWIRSFLIEDVYCRLSESHRAQTLGSCTEMHALATMFPESGNLISSDDECVLRSWAYDQPLTSQIGLCEWALRRKSEHSVNVL